MNTSKELPKYRSHKIVHALKIKELQINEVDAEIVILVPEEKEFASFILDKEYVKKHNPQVGGYYVVYEDGYLSWSPAEAFNGGYTKIEGKSDSTKKTFGNTTASGAKKNVKDIQFWGDGDMFRLISKAWSEEENWMKSTKAMQLPHGVLIQVTTQQGDNVAEALQFIPGVQIMEWVDKSIYTVNDLPRGSTVTKRTFEMI